MNSFIAISVARTLHWLNFLKINLISNNFIPYVIVMYNYLILCDTAIPVVIIPVVSVACGSI